MADKKTSGNGNGNGSSSHEYINEAGIGNADDEDYCKKVLKIWVRNIWVFSPLVPLKQEKNISVLLSLYTYFLREVCLLFNFRMIKFTIHRGVLEN